MRWIFLVGLAALVILAGCTQQTDGTDGDGATGPTGIKVSCADTSLTRFASGGPGNGDAVCDVNVEVRRINREAIVCQNFVTIRENGDSVVPCPGLTEMEDGWQLKVTAEFYEARTTNSIGQDDQTMYYRK